jgi:ferric-dicitrate binding protein FerR (iron transport regulator)
MNPHELEQLLLREQSGELSPSQRRALDAEFAANPAARRFRDQLRALAGAAPAPAAGPAPDAAARIAARLSPRPRIFTWKPLLATAAALALLLGVYALRPGPASAPVATVAVAAAAEDEDWTDLLDDDFTELEDLLAAIAAEDPFADL